MTMRYCKCYSRLILQGLLPLLYAIIGYVRGFKNQQLNYLYLVVALTLMAVNTVHADANGTNPSAYGTVTLRYPASGDFVWCGSKHLALSHGKFPGIRLLNINNGTFIELSTDKPHQHAVACTPDGKNLFFIDNAVSGEMNVLDISSGKQQVVYSGNKRLQSKIEKSPVSLSGRSLLGPVSFRRDLELSDQRIKGLYIPNILKEEVVDDVAWADDETLYILFGGSTKIQKLFIQSSLGQGRVVNLPNETGYWFKQIEWGGQANSLYLLAWPDNDMGDSKLFSFAPSRQMDGLKLLVSGHFDSFGVLGGQGVVYIQTVGVEYNQDNSYVSDSAQSIIKLYSVALEKSRDLFSIDYSPEYIRDLRVSPDRSHLAFLYSKKGNKNKEIVVYLVN